MEAKEQTHIKIKKRLTILFVLNKLALLFHCLNKTDKKICGKLSSAWISSYESQKSN